MNLEGLLEALAAPDVAGLEDIEAANVLAAETEQRTLTEAEDTAGVTWITERSLARLFGYARAGAILLVAEAAANPPDTAPLESLVFGRAIKLLLETLRAYDATPPGLSVASAQAPALLGQLTTAGIITADERDALLGLATVTVPRWPGITHLDVARARGRG